MQHTIGFYCDSLALNELILIKGCLQGLAGLGSYKNTIAQVIRRVEHKDKDNEYNYELVPSSMSANEYGQVMREDPAFQYSDKDKGQIVCLNFTSICRPKENDNHEINIKSIYNSKEQTLFMSTAIRQGKFFTETNKIRSIGETIENKGLHTAVKELSQGQDSFAFTVVDKSINQIFFTCNHRRPIFFARLTGKILIYSTNWNAIVLAVKEYTNKDILDKTRLVGNYLVGLDLDNNKISYDSFNVHEKKT
jgi:hypothetical protein